jgi:hypothetical protein
VPTRAPKDTDNDALLVDCFLCKRPFRFGDLDDGRYIPVWNVTVCSPCLSGNHDGVAPDTCPHLLPYLNAIGVKVRFNAKGRIDLPQP